MPQTRPIHQHFPGRSGPESLQRIGTLEILDSGEMRIVLDAVPCAAGSSLVVLPPAQTLFPQPTLAPYGALPKP